MNRLKLLSGSHSGGATPTWHSTVAESADHRRLANSCVTQDDDLAHGEGGVTPLQRRHLLIVYQTFSLHHLFVTIFLTSALTGFWGFGVLGFWGNYDLYVN